jgi:hypothetical protein
MDSRTLVLCGPEKERNLMFEDIPDRFSRHYKGAIVAENSEQLDRLKQIAEFMEAHNIVKLKTGEFQIERGSAPDASDAAQRRELDENMKAEAERIALIRMNCPYPCPHWEAQKKEAHDGSRTAS